MTPGATLSRYIAVRFLGWCATVFAAMEVIVFLLDYVELIRRAASRQGATLLSLLEMAALKQPYMAQQIMPFAVLFGTMLLFWRMTRSNELVTARSAGVSAWQFLAPAIVTAFLVGVFAVTVFNPFASITQARFEALESHILQTSSANNLTVSRNGFWLRQSDNSGAAAVIHADAMRMPQTRLSDVTILTFAHDTKLTGRIDAQSAALGRGKWRIENGTRWTPMQPSAPFTEFDLPTNLTPHKIQEGFAAPETMSFWQLPGFIGLLERSGFSAQRHRLYFDALLARPFLFTGIVVVAAVFSLRMQRRGGVGLMIGAGIGCGFALYFLSDVVLALGLAAAIPVALAAWIPTGVSWLIGASLVFHLEDG
jgi:lipopolysaccharide export system permease protein